MSSDLKCALGEDCDMTIAYMLGAEKAKDTITALRAEVERLNRNIESWKQIPKQVAGLYEAENERLRAALLSIRDMGPMTVDDQRWRTARAALEGRE